MQTLEKAQSEWTGAGEPPDPSGVCEDEAGGRQTTCVTHLPAHLPIYSPLFPLEEPMLTVLDAGSQPFPNRRDLGFPRKHPPRCTLAGGRRDGAACRAHRSSEPLPKG